MLFADVFILWETVNRFLDFGVVVQETFLFSFLVMGFVGTKVWFFGGYEKPLLLRARVFLDLLVRVGTAVLLDDNFFPEEE